MLQRLREVEQRAREAEAAATGSLNNMGMSARATAAAMRGVPAQFQDIIVSLQGGQAPMTVLLQQGSQLSGMFGGAGNAAKALGTYIVGLVNPLTIAAAAVAGLGFAMYSLNGKDAALRDLSAQLIGTGRASAAAVGDIKALVNELNTVPGVSKAAATAIIGEFAKVSGLGSSLFKGLGSSVADFAAATGTDLPTAAKKLAEAFADPAKGAKALEDTLGTLTAAQILTITTMAEMGDKSGAQAALLDALKQATEGLAKQGMTPLGEATDKMSNAWDKLTTSVGNSSAFRTANDWLAKLIEKTAELTVQLSQMQPPTWLKFLPVVGPAIGAASLLAGPEANAGGSRSASGKVGNVEGGATGSWGPTSQEMEGQVKAALDLTKSYESQSAAMEKLRGVAKVAKDALKELEAQNRGNSVEAKELRERITGVNEKLAEMAKKGQGDVKAEQNAYESLIASIKAKIEEDKKELSGNRALTESQKIRIKLDEDLAAGKLKLSSAHQAVVVASLNELAAQEKLAVEAKDALKVAQARQALREKETDSIAAWLAAQDAAASAALASVRERTMGLQDEGRALALSVSANISLAEAVERVAQARLLEKQAQFVEGSEGYLNIQKEIDARKELLALISSNEANKKFISDWKDSVSAYEDVFRRGFADMLNNGRDGWKSFTRSLVTTFKTAVADQIYKMFAQKFVVNIVGNLLGVVGGGATAAVSGAAAAASGGSALSTVGGIGSAISAGTSAFGIGASYGFQSLFANGLTGTLAAGGQMIGAGSIASGLGTIAGALGPIALGVGALMAIAKATKGETRTGGQFGVAFDGSVTNQRRGQTYTIEGQQFDRDFTNGLQTALKDGIAYRLEGDPVAQESAIREAVAGTASGINGFLKALGSSATLTGFSAGLETSGKGRGGVFAGGLLSTGAAFGESGKGDNYAGTLYEAFSTNSPDFKTALENFTLDLKQATIQALQTVSDIPQAVQKMLQGVDAEALTEDAANKLLETINAQIVGVENLRTSFENIGLDKLAEMSFDAASGLAAAAGGFDALQGKLATYYDAFYSEEEKRANTIRQITKTLRDAGAQVTADDVGKATREQFRAIYESIVDVGGAADPVAVALLNVAGAFASVTPAAADAANAAKELADSQAADAARRAQEVARERYDIETELYNLLGDTNKLRERELATIDASNRSLKEFVYSLQDAFSAVDDAFGTVQRSVAAQKEALQTEFNAGQKQRQQAQSDAQATSGLIDGISKAIANALGAQTIESQAFDNMRRAQAQAQLDNFLASVMGGGSVADLPGLDRTLGTLGKDSRAGFGRFEDYAYDRGVTAGKLAELGTLADAQKSVAEKTLEQITAGNEAAQAAFDAQIATLDATLTTAQGLLDAVNGVDTSVMGVAEAMDRFSETLINLEEIRSARSVARALANQGGGTAPTQQSREYTDAELRSLGFDPADIRAYAQQAANAGSSAARGGLEGVINEIIGFGQQAIDIAMGLNLTGGTTTKYGSYSDFGQYLSQFTDAQRVAASEGFTTNAGGNYITGDQLQAILSIGSTAPGQLYSAKDNIDLEDFLKKVPQYEQGTPYVPNDGLAFLHQGEKVIPAQYNNAVSLLQSGGASNAEIAAALRAMAARLDAIEANTRAAAGHAAGTDQRLSRVIENDAFRTRETA
jgi:hypothetical protein